MQFVFAAIHITNVKKKKPTKNQVYCFTTVWEAEKHQ